MSARCGSRNEAIVWATTDNGVYIPLNAVPDENGNVAAHRDTGGGLLARVLKDGEETAPWETRGTSHFATCPNASQHRRSKRRQKTECRVVEVDGTSVLVRGQGEPTAEDLAALAEVVAAAKRKFEAEAG